MKIHIAISAAVVLFLVGLFLFPAVYGKQVATFWNISNIAVFAFFDIIGAYLIAATMKPWIMLVGLVMVLGIPGLIFANPGMLGLPAASVGGTGATTGNTAGGISGSGTSAATPCVSTLQAGTASSLMIGAYDKDSATPATDVNLGASCYIFKHTAPGQSTDTLSYAGITASTSPTALTGVASIGDVIDVYCGGTSYYVEPVKNYCVSTATAPINLNAHAIAATSEVKTNCYTNTGATACTGGTNASLETWKGTFGANQDDVYYLQLQVNTSYKTYNLGGMATYGLGHCDQYEPASGMTNVISPKVLKNAQVEPVLDPNNVTVSFNLWKLPAPVMLHNWATYMQQMKVSSDASNPSTTATFTASSQGFACFLDSQWALDNNQQPQLDIYQHDGNTEALVGSTEQWGYTPGGTYACTSLELV